MATQLVRTLSQNGHGVWWLWWFWLWCRDDAFVHIAARLQTNYGGHVPVDMTPGPVPVCRAPTKTHVRDLKVSASESAFTFTKKFCGNWKSHRTLTQTVSSVSRKLRVLQATRAPHKRLPEQLAHEQHPLASQATYSTGNKDTEQGLPDT